MAKIEMTQEAQALRVDIAAAFRWLRRWEMDDLAGGGLVARLPGQTDWMLTNIQGMYFDEIKASDLIRVSFDNEVLDGSNLRSNYGAVNPAAKLFNARPDVNAVVHVHCEPVMAMLALKCGILPISAPAFMFQEGVAYIETDFHFKDDYCERMAETLGDGKILMIHNHSYTSVGRTVAEAMVNSYYLDQACRIQMRSLATNQELKIPSAEELESHARSFTPDNTRKLEYDGSLEWPGLLRKLDREEPDYRN